MADDQATQLPLIAVLTHAVTQLYMDEALPRAKLLQWRLQVLLGRSVSVTDLRKACTEAPGLVLEPPETKKGNFLVLLETQPHGFNGFVCQEVDPIEESLWQHVEKVLSKGGWEQTNSPDHNMFAVAQHLRSQPGPLSSLSFGRSLAVVRQALSTFKILGKCGEHVVPYDISDDNRKRFNMSRKRPTGVSVGERYIKTPQGFCACLAYLVEQEGNVTVSRIKQLFRDRLGGELSETALGCFSVVELMNSIHVAKVFEVASTEKGTPMIHFVRGARNRYSGTSIEDLQKHFETLSQEVPPPPAQKTALPVLPEVPPLPKSPVRKQKRSVDDPQGDAEAIELRHTIHGHANEVELEETQGSTVFVGNVPNTITEDEVRCIFSKIGPVLEVRIKNKLTNQVRSKPPKRTYCFVAYGSCRHAQCAIQEFHGKSLFDSSSVKVAYGKKADADCKDTSKNKHREDHEDDEDTEFSVVQEGNPDSVATHKRTIDSGRDLPIGHVKSDHGAKDVHSNEKVETMTKRLVNRKVPAKKGSQHHDSPLSILSEVQTSLSASGIGEDSSTSNLPQGIGEVSSRMSENSSATRPTSITSVDASSSVASVAATPPQWPRWSSSIESSTASGLQASEHGNERLSAPPTTIWSNTIHTVQETPNIDASSSSLSWGGAGDALDWNSVQGWFGYGSDFTSSTQWNATLAHVTHEEASTAQAYATHSALHEHVYNTPAYMHGESYFSHGEHAMASPEDTSQSLNETSATGSANRRALRLREILDEAEPPSWTASYVVTTPSVASPVATPERAPWQVRGRTLVPEVSPDCTGHNLSPGLQLVSAPHTPHRSRRPSPPSITPQDAEQGFKGNDPQTPHRSRRPSPPFLTPLDAELQEFQTYDPKPASPLPSRKSPPSIHNTGNLSRPRLARRSYTSSAPVSRGTSLTPERWPNSCSTPGESNSLFTILASPPPSWVNCGNDASPAPLPPWCMVNRTFIDTRGATSYSPPRSSRATSAPPASRCQHVPHLPRSPEWTGPEASRSRVYGRYQ